MTRDNTFYYSVRCFYEKSGMDIPSFRVFINGTENFKSLSSNYAIISIKSDNNVAWIAKLVAPIVQIASCKNILKIMNYFHPIFNFIWAVLNKIIDQPCWIVFRIIININNMVVWIIHSLYAFKILFILIFGPYIIANWE